MLLVLSLSLEYTMGAVMADSVSRSMKGIGGSINAWKLNLRKRVSVTVDFLCSSCISFD